MLLDADTNLVIHAEKQQKMQPRIFTQQIYLTQRNNHYQVVCHHPPEALTRRDNHYQVVCHHPPEALIQFHEPAAPFKMDKLDPQIPRIGSPLM